MADRTHRIKVYWWSATAGLVLAQIIALRLEGRVWWCQQGDWGLWAGGVWSAHNSQHLFDPYTFSHVLHGILFCSLAWLGLKNWTWENRLFMATAVEAAWEVFENTPFCIDRYRKTMALGYSGDSIFNSVGDTFACAAGFWLAWKLGFRKSALVFLATEIVMALWIRDNLTLNVVMLIYPFDAIMKWQTPGQ